MKNYIINLKNKDDTSLSKIISKSPMITKNISQGKTLKEMIPENL